MTNRLRLPRWGWLGTLMFGSVALTSSVYGQLADGFGDLQDRLGAETPTGASVGLGMGEALSGTNYKPNSSNYGIAYQVIEMSGPSGESGHASSVVSQYVVRCPSIATVWAWEALDFLQGGLLNFGGGLPSFPPAGIDLFNHSWVASGEDAASGNDALRRFDYQVVRDGTLSMVGIGNNPAAPPNYLMSSQYNGITVGAFNTAHGDTPGGGRDGQGRMKPDIAVQSVGASSTATPIVTAVAGVLVETAATDPTLLANPDASDEQVLKAVILGSARRSAEWSNQPALKGEARGRTARPIDPTWGAGFVDANRAHLVLTGGEQDPAATVPAEANVSSRGWSRVSISSGARRYWRFSIGEAADEVAILATWPRVVSSNFASWSLMNIDLTLHRVEGTTLVPLTGDGGLPYFASGNVVSESLVDNVELLVVRDLAPGDYVFEVYRHVGATSTSVAVAWIMPETTPPAPVGDINGDGIVDGADLGLLLIDWGACPVKGPCDGDLNGDGAVNGADLGLLLLNWG
jgi:hypothetical protein